MKCKKCFSSLARDYGEWYILVIDNLSPFSTFEKYLFRKHIKYSDILLTSFMKYLLKLTEPIDKKVAN